MSSTRRDFGSFHSSNVEELIHLSEEEYIAPQQPFKLPTFPQNEKEGMRFGSEMRRSHFYLEEDTVFLNHGAFGAVLKEAMEVAQKWQVYIEKQPLRFFDRELLPHLVHVTRRLTKFVGCEPQDLVLMPNVTTAVNTVIRSQKLQPGDSVYMLSTEYGAVKKIVRQVCEETGAEVQEEHLTFPLTSPDQIIHLVESTLRPGTKLAVFDHIPSNTPFVMPVKQLSALCHSRGVRVLVDGAHALGGVSLRLSDLDVDYYTSNAHKWLCSMKGAAFMYVRRGLQKNTRPLVISHGLHSGFSSEFIWSGLRDYSPLLALHTNLDFYESLGSETVYQHNHQLATNASKMLVSEWDTGLLVNDRSLTGCPMQCVRLPAKLYESTSPVDYSQAECVQNMLFHRFNIEVPVKAVGAALYVRISAHVYNKMEEYVTLARAVLTLVDDLTLEEEPQG